MYTRLLVTAPAAEPVKLSEFKDFARIDYDARDIDLLRLIKAARQRVESLTGLALITQTWDISLPCFPASDTIILPLPPLQSITSITYVDSADSAPVTVASSEYYVDSSSRPGRVVLRYMKSWPNATLRTSNPVTIRQVCGFGATGASVPDDLRNAIFLLAEHWNRNTGISATGMISHEIKHTFDALIADHTMRELVTW